MAGKYLFVCVCEDLPSVYILGEYVIVVFDIQRCLFFPAFSLELPAVSIQLRRFPNLPLFRSFAPVNPKIIQLQGVHQLSPILLFTCGDPVKSGGDLVGCFSNSLSMWPPGL